MPSIETSLDEFLEVANEATLSAKQSVTTLLARSERVLTRKLKTKGDCEDYLQIIKSEGDKFNECLKVLANTRKKYDAGKMSKEDFNSTIKNAIVLLKKNCQHLQIRLGNVVSDTKAVTTQEIADFKEFLEGLKKIVKNRLRYLNARPASESAFVNDEENFAPHFIFAKEGDGTELPDEDDSELPEVEDSDDDDDDDKKKKSKKSKSKKDDDDDDDSDDDDKKEDDEDDSESGFKDGKDPEEDDDDDDDKKKKSKKSKSKKDNDDEDDSDDDDKKDDDDDSEDESKESAIIDQLLDNYAYNVENFGVESALDTFYNDLNHIDAMESTSADVTKAKAFAATARMCSDRKQEGESAMESTIFGQLLDNYAYNVENYGLESATVQLGEDMDALEASAGREAEKYAKAGAVAQHAGMRAHDISENAYTKKDLAKANRYRNITNSLANYGYDSEGRRITARAYNASFMHHGNSKQIGKLAKAGATTGALTARAIAAKGEGLPGKAKRYAELANKIHDKYMPKNLDSSIGDMYQSAHNYGKNKTKLVSKESALFDALCDNLIYNEENFGLEAALNQFDSDIESVDMPEFDDAMEAAIVGGGPGTYTIKTTNSSDWINNAIDARINDPTRVAHDVTKSLSKKDGKKMLAIANKMAKLNSKLPDADSAKKKKSIENKMKKLLIEKDAINAARKASGYAPITLEAALAEVEYDDECRAYEDAIDFILDNMSEEALESDKEITLTPGDYKFGGIEDEDSKHFIRKAFDRRLNDPDRIEAKTNKYVNKVSQSANKKDAKKLSALANKIEKLELKKKSADSVKAKAKIDYKIRKLKGASTAINMGRKSAGYKEISLDSALAMLGVEFEYDTEFMAYENAIDDILESEADIDTCAVEFAAYSVDSDDGIDDDVDGISFIEPFEF